MRRIRGEEVICRTVADFNREVAALSVTVSTIGEPDPGDEVMISTGRGGRALLIRYEPKDADRDLFEGYMKKEFGISLCRLSHSRSAYDEAAIQARYESFLAGLKAARGQK